jgi:hypothetical protein
VPGATAPTAAAVATAVWQDLLAGSDFTTSSSIGKLLKDDIDAAVSSRSTYAGGDTSGTTTLLSRIASALSITGGKVDVNDKTGFSLSAGGVQAIWDALSSALTTVGSIGKRLVDFVTGDSYGRLGAPAGASVSADVAAVKSDTAAVKTQTDKLAFTVPNQVDSNVLDWKSATAPAMTGDAFARVGAPAGASLAADVAAVKTVADAVNAKTTNLPPDPADASDIAASFATVNATLATIAAYVDTEVAAIKAVTDQFTAAQSEPSAVPAANATPLQKIAWLAALARNKVTQTATTQTLRNDADAGTIGAATVSDDGTTFTRGKFA